MGYPFVTPWDEKSKRILEQMVRDGKAFTSDIELPRAFGRRYPELVDNDFISIARADRKKETVFVTKPNVMIVPIPTRSSHNYKLKYKFHKIF